MQATAHGRLQRAYVAVLGQLIVCAAAAGVLLGVAPRIADASADAICVWLLATTLHALASLRFVDHAVAYLHLDCPKCHQSVHGFPERLPRYSRDQCAHCGTEVA